MKTSCLESEFYIPVSLFLVAKPHGANLIGVTEFRNATSASPRYGAM